MGDFAFDEDSRVVAAGSEGAFTTGLTSRWNGTAGAVNGGYMLAICTRALALGMPFPDPVVVSGFFLRPGTAGPAAVSTSVIRSGRSTAFGEAALTQDGKDVVRVTAAFARLGSAGPSAGAGADAGAGGLRGLGFRGNPGRPVQATGPDPAGEPLGP
jgi:acyl-coenzyme A thioesterase PaaI-like protein